MVADIGVVPGYVHAPKEVIACAPLELPAATLKWYELHSPGQPVPLAVAALARAPFASGVIEAKGLGFVIVHRCGAGFYFLIATTWRNENELWETVWFKDDGMQEFAEFPRRTAKLPTFCVWELAIVGSETQSWIRFISSDRSAAAVGRWLAERHQGPA